MSIRSASFGTVDGLADTNTFGSRQRFSRSSQNSDYEDGSRRQNSSGLDSPMRLSGSGNSGKLQNSKDNLTDSLLGQVHVSSKTAEDELYLDYR
jgi:hypothetical protein